MPPKRMTLVIACLLPVMAFANTNAPLSNEQIMQELTALRTTVMELSKQVEELKKSKPDAADAWGHSHTSIKADPEKLRAIKLPENPTKQDINKYIREIKIASSKQNSFSPSDPQVDMLTQLGADNIHLLIDNFSNTSGSFHLEYAIRSLVDETHKELILDQLPHCKNLAALVIKFNWELDARDTLLEQLRNLPEHLPAEWIEAVANLKDPETYPLLRDYLISGSNKSSTYKHIKNLPIDDLPGAIDIAWEECRVSHPYSRESMALIAATFGHLDALETVVELATTGRPTYWNTREAKRVLRKHTEFREAPSKLEAWFETNKDKLKFDPESRRFVIEGADKKTA